jgi:hypothetical protein
LENFISKLIFVSHALFAFRGINRIVLNSVAIARVLDTLVRGRIRQSLAVALLTSFLSAVALLGEGWSFLVSERGVANQERGRIDVGVIGLESRHGAHGLHSVEAGGTLFKSVEAETVTILDICQV